MKEKRWLLIPGLVGLSVLLMTCKPIGFYLEKVYKVYGTVTVATEDTTLPPTPIRSVEVFVGDYQYSELTNYDGDYELEMAEGTWTVNFVKDGYETFTEKVTVGPDNSRVRLDAAMTPVAPPPPPPPPADPLVGQWHGAFSSATGSPVTVLFEFFDNLTYTQTITTFPLVVSGTYVEDTTAQTFTVTVTETSNATIIPVGFTYATAYSFSADNNTLTIASALGNGALTRGPYIVGPFGTWTGTGLTADGIPMGSPSMTLTEGGAFAITYTAASALNNQTGTFSPPDLPQNTVISFTVSSSAGPAVPPPGSSYRLIFSSVTLFTMNLEIDLYGDGFQGPFVMQRQ